MSLNTRFDKEFGAFLAAWVHHEELREGGALPELVDSRRQLDDLRYRVWVASHNNAR